MKISFPLKALAGCGLLLAATFLLGSGCSKKEDAATPTPTYSDEEREKSPESAIEKVLKDNKANPNNPETLYHLATIYDRQGQYQKAAEAFQKVVELKPDKGYAYLKLGTAYSQLNEPEKAVVALLQAVHYLPDMAIAYNNLAIAYGKLGKLDEEIAYLQKALQLRPIYNSARYNLGMTYLKKGDQAAARQEYEILKGQDTKMAAELLHTIESRK